jgi:acetolactate synthase-1/2/3 large subunit
VFVEWLQPLHRDALFVLAFTFSSLAILRPVLYVGQGAVNAVAEVKEVANSANIPVCTTLHGMGMCPCLLWMCISLCHASVCPIKLVSCITGIFDELHPLSLHMVGMHGSVYANYAIQNADLVVAIGSRFDDRSCCACLFLIRSFISLCLSQ